MNRRRFLRSVAMAGVGGLAAPMLNLGRVRLFAQDGSRVLGTTSVRAVDLVHRTTVIDMLSLLTLEWPRLERWQRQPETFGEADFAHLRASGIDVFHPAVDPNEPDAGAAVLAWLAGWDRLLDAHPLYFLRVASVTDLDRARESGRLGLLLGFQNSDHFQSVADVERFYRLGQRVSQLTYNTRNRLGSGCKEEDRGLSVFGADVIGEMNRVGMVIDVSHCGERTTLDAFAASKKPVLVTHSNCRALVPGAPRCKTDAELRAMAAQGGVMGITAVRAFVSAHAPSLDDLLNHFAHVAYVAGIEHVGLGSDVDVDARDPRTGSERAAYAIRGMTQARRTFEVVDGLLRRGWTEPQLELVLGGNFRRALGAIWEQTALPVPLEPLVPPTPAA
jgi:membrane dipeptidase